MPNPHISTQDWFYHAPSKKSSKSAKPAPPASQIPGIGGLKDELANPEQDDRHFRRKWIRDTDSKYIKLAKAGGRKNLLAFRSPPTKADEPVPYPRVDWFDHDPPEEDDLNEVQHTVQHDEQHTNSKQGYSVLPDWYVHEHDLPADDVGTMTDVYQSKQPIMGFDNLSKWQRDTKKDKKDNLNTVHLPPLRKVHKSDRRFEELKEAQIREPQQRKFRLPQIGSEPVNFKHLMSMGYQQDWLNENGKKAKEEREEKQKQKRESEEKRDTQNRHVAPIRKPMNTLKNDSPLFKLSRFEKVQPRVETFRT
ncbi:uncharacterized protein C7orf57 homolog isoform X2 [Montipora foliosa]|uniref:uncharacterized protein C7orf57 homolog isoform X2 n=1 Tax=Montipora foliosa TaxID=591990 RepID=UPI0035F16011